MSDFTWGPINMAVWKSVPCVSGRPAEKEDVVIGRAVFWVEKSSRSKDHLTHITLPACGIFHSASKGYQPVVIIQEETTSHTGTLFGFRYINGDRGVCEAKDVEILGEPNAAFTRLVAELPKPYNAAERERRPPTGPYSREVCHDPLVTIHEILPTGRLGWLLKEAEDAGALPDFVVMDIRGSGLPAEKLHWSAAALSLKVTQRKTDEWAHSLAVQLWMPRNKLFRISVDLTKLVGRRVTLAQFMGSGYDVNMQRYIKVQSEGEYATDGYAQAFYEPVHSLGLSDAHHFFDSLNVELFGGVAHPSLEIFSWSTECSNYFDAGKEWWGAHFWTVHNPVMNRIVGIMASSTD
jgi:hypothetical protein